MLDTSWECHKVREFALRPMGDCLLMLDRSVSGVHSWKTVSLYERIPDNQDL